MKRLLFVLMAVLLLSACGEKIVVHENINQELAEDTIEMLGIIEDVSKKDRGFTEEERAKLDQYSAHYSTEFTDEERRVYVLTEDLIEYVKEITIEQEDFKSEKERVLKVMETGNF
ncbi:membrane lipoprotein lipid attachment site-containing protein [Pseudogracilibacillus auburnensis]|uniref:membrane lipoprotein lipid attachment site-containing protein n=1 Tax=Pseudogracilibacillus auburnensis TaxID=1494959 RepID=UPI001A95F314|nr:membrane lipoprotein lipid attachment site-containing protein [Pseudogracilibacillus auburnensis]MBO1003166.1 membrane lipoprotein lipid attachment site-containing protein [Pseudogracilibacillus auburnensis]